jgi:uncharacterized lipoprotein YddW (UPF0748 family)
MTLMLAAALMNQSSLPPLPREFRAAWVATVDNIDWPSKRNLTTDQARQELLDIIIKARDLKLNALVFQVRPSADALYESKYEPWSEYLTGQQGKAPNPKWDPLEFAIQESHKRGIELHVWFNPYRVIHPAQKGPISSDSIAKTHPSVVKQYGKYLWMDPSEPFVQKRSTDVFLDVVKRYDIDGAHIDDYFYPYPIKENGKDVDFPDAESYQRYLSKGGKLGRKDWRRKQVDHFIEKVYKQIKKEKPHVKFGISPFGIYRPGVPTAQIKAGIDQYDELYADCEKWLKEGWCDYFTPQLYWSVTSPGQPYEPLLRYWLSVNPKGRHVWPGLYTSRTEASAKPRWEPNEIISQVEISRKIQPTAGHVHFSFKALQYNWNGVGTATKLQYAQDAFVPESRWLGAHKPAKPSIGMTGGRIWIEAGKGGELIAFSVGKAESSGTKWGVWKTYEWDKGVVLAPGEVIAAVTLSRNSVASDPEIFDRR